MKLFVSFVVIRKSAVTKKPPQAPTGHGLRWQGGSRDTAFVRTESFQTLGAVSPAPKRRGAALPAALHDTNCFAMGLCECVRLVGETVCLVRVRFLAVPLRFGAIAGVFAAILFLNHPIIVLLDAIFIL